MHRHTRDVWRVSTWQPTSREIDAAWTILELWPRCLTEGATRANNERDITLHREIEGLQGQRREEQPPRDGGSHEVIDDERGGETAQPPQYETVTGEVNQEEAAPEQPPTEMQLQDRTVVSRTEWKKMKKRLWPDDLEGGWITPNATPCFVFHGSAGWLLMPGYYVRSGALCPDPKVCLCTTRNFCRNMRAIISAVVHVACHQSVSIRELEQLWGVSRQSMQRVITTLQIPSNREIIQQLVDILPGGSVLSTGKAPPQDVHHHSEVHTASYMQVCLDNLLNIKALYDTTRAHAV